MKIATKNHNSLILLRIVGALGEIRTPDPQIRSPMVEPHHHLPPPLLNLSPTTRNSPDPAVERID
jgi:hypothetical protein